ncbi:MAG: hypothetical protein GYB67_11245, partial [Chloroflexi bacterium]|nr:hypothetical protein [Chloroflexota bacterium]
MTFLLLVPLDDQWQCEYFEIEPDLFEFADGLAVPSLEAWTFERRYTEGWAAWLQRSFTLRPLDTCVRYQLHIS